MRNARDEFADLFIDALKDYMMVFVLQRLVHCKHEFTIGQLAKRVLKTKLREMLQKYSEKQLLEIVNLHPKTLREKIRALEENHDKSSEE
jgi:hypothetical protein